MKSVFLVIAILINFFNHTLIKSEEKIDTATNKIENTTKKELITEDKTGIRKNHIVKIGDTISSISKFYSINKDLIIKLNNLKNENHIFVGQNLIISESTDNPSNQSVLINNYHIVQAGETLTEISSKYKLNLKYLIEINNLKSPDSIKVGQSLLLSKIKPISSGNYQISKNKKNNELLELDKQIYGPIIIKSKSFAKNKDSKVLNVLNKENQKLILSINCDSNEINVRIPGRKWSGEEPAKEEFEKNLINDYC